MRTQALWRTDSEALPSEMVSLSERLSHMLIVRIALVAVTLCSGFFGVGMEGGGAAALLTISGGYVLLSLIVEGVRRAGGGRGLVVIGIVLLVDGVYLGWVTYSSGGAHSPLRFLLYAHLIAVTLLASYRTGLKIALWHSLLVFVAFYAQLAGFLPPVEVAKGSTEFAATPFHRLSVYNLMAFWFVAVGTATFSAFNERTLRRRGFDLEALALMAAEMDKVSDTTGAAECLVNIAADTFSFESAAVLVMVDGRLTVVAERGCGPSPKSDLLSDRAIVELERNRKTFMLKDVDPMANAALMSLFPRGKRIVLVPLVIENEWVGAVVAEASSKRRHRVDSSVLRVVEQFATQAAVALSNVWLLEQVQKLADTDSLTGIANRLVFDRTLSAELKRADRNGESVGLIMVDIDHFKTLNDRYGHQTGDETLRILAAALGAESRDFDLVARYGGEEFAIILPATNPAAGAATGERFRRLIEQLETHVPITGSIGVASFPENAIDPDGLVRAADTALYDSKRAGRNRVTVSQERPSLQTVSG